MAQLGGALLALRWSWLAASATGPRSAGHTRFLPAMVWAPSTGRGPRIPRSARATPELVLSRPRRIPVPAAERALRITRQAPTRKVVRVKHPPARTPEYAIAKRMPLRAETLSLHCARMMVVTLRPRRLRQFRFLFVEMCLL